MKRSLRTAHRASAVAVALAFLTGCGSTDGDTGSGAPGPTTVITRQAGGGTVLTDPAGRTLYVTDQDTAGSIKCTGECERVWPPLTISAGSTPTGPAGLPADLGTTTRPDGATQVTYDGKPLYTFSLDAQPGAVTGDGLSDNFGATRFSWRAVFTEGGGGTPTTQDPGYPY